MLDRGNELRIGGRQDRLLGGELGVEVVCLTLGLSLGLEWRRDLQIGKLDPVNLAEEGMLLNVLFAGRTAAETLLGVAREELQMLGRI